MTLWIALAIAVVLQCTHGQLLSCEYMANGKGLELL